MRRMSFIAYVRTSLIHTVIRNTESVTSNLVYTLYDKRERVHFIEYSKLFLTEFDARYMVSIVP